MIAFRKMAIEALHNGNRLHYRLTFVLLAAAGMSYSLLQSLVAPALPEIQRALHTSVQSVSWVLTAYLLSASIATPLIGRLGDMYGKERLLVAVMIALCVATVVCAASTSLPVMLAGRVGQGAAGGIFPLAFGIIRDEFPHALVAGAIGFMSALLAVGGGVGVVLAGPVVGHFSYHYLFWLPLLLLVPTMLAVWRWVPVSPVRLGGKVSWPSAVLMSISLSAVLIAVSEAPDWRWVSPKTLLMLTLGTIGLVVWIARETHSANPLVEMSTMRLRGVWTTNIVAALLGFGMYSSFILMPEYVEMPARSGSGFGASVTGAGLFMLPSTLAMLVVGTRAGRLQRRLGSKLPLRAGACFCTASLAVFAFARDQQWEVYLASMLLGIGVGLAFASMVNLIIENVGAGQTGIATGVNTVMRTIGGAFGGAVAASILGASVTNNGDASARGFTFAFVSCAIAAALAVAIGAAIPHRRRESVAAAQEVADVI